MIKRESRVSRVPHQELKIESGSESIDDEEKFLEGYLANTKGVLDRL